MYSLLFVFGIGLLGTVNANRYYTWYRMTDCLFFSKTLQHLKVLCFSTVIGLSKNLKKKVRDHPFSTYAKFCEKPVFFTPWYAHVRMDGSKCAWRYYLSVSQLAFACSKLTIENRVKYIQKLTIKIPEPH